MESVEYGSRVRKELPGQQEQVTRGDGGEALTFQSHGFHLRRLALITLQLPLGNGRRLPQVEEGAPAAHRRFFHFILRPPPMREKIICIKISKGLTLLKENELMMERTKQPGEAQLEQFTPAVHTAHSTPRS